MTRWTLPLTIVAFLLCLVGPAAAGPDLTVSSLQGQGAVTTAGRFAAASFFSGASAPLDPPPTTDPAFHLQAQDVRVRTYVDDHVTHAQVTSVGSPSPRVEDRNLTRATVTGTALRTDYWMSVFPLEGHAQPGWNDTSQCLDAMPTQGGVVHSNPHAGAPSDTTDTSGSIGWGYDCPGTRHVVGDFRVTLWQWDAHAEDAAGAVDLPSGEEPTTPNPLLGYPYVAESRDRQVVLDVTGGDLALPRLEGTPGYLFLFAADARIVGSLSLQGATGTIEATGEQASAKTVALAGDFHVLLTGTSGAGDRLPVAVLGQVAGGQHAAVQQLPAGARWVWGISFVLAAAATVLVLAVRNGWRLLRHGHGDAERAMDLCSAAETLVLEGRFARARRLLDRAIRMDPLQPDFYALRARCRAGTGDFQRALEDHERAHEGFPFTDPDARASNALDAARASSRAGRTQEAVAWLRLAVKYDPSIRAMAADDPFLLGLVSRTSVRPKRADR